MSVAVWRKLVAGAAIGILAFGLSACGEDDDEDAGTASEAAAETAGTDVTEYCEYSASLDDGDELPTDDELDRLTELAPEAIAEQVELVAEAIKEQGDVVFGDESNTEFFGALEDIEAFEERECGREDSDTGDTREEG